MLHNHTGADFEIGVAPVEPTEPEAWRPLVPHDPSVRLEEVDAFAGHLVVHQRSDGLTQLRILELGPDGLGDDYLVEFDEEVYTVGSGGNPSFTQPRVRLGYTTDGDPVVGLRLRRPHPRADPAPAYARARRLRPGRLRGAPALGHRRRRRADPDLGRGQARLTRGSAGFGRRWHPSGPASCSTGTAPTRCRWTRTSRSPGSPSSTAAPRSPSPTCAAAARWAAGGTTTASCCTSRTPSATSSPAPATSPRPAGPPRS